MRRCLVCAVACAACGPTAGQGEPSGTASSPTDDTSGATTKEIDASSSDGSVPPTTTGPDSDESGSTASGEPTDPCLGYSYEDCPSDCEWQTLWRVTDDTACTVEYDRSVCLSPGDWPGIGATRSYYGTLDGDLVFSEVGVSCGTNSPPIAFEECEGLVDDSAGCRCFCGVTGCPSDADWLALDACGWDEPCELVFFGGDTTGPLEPIGAECILSALRDHVPGRYEAGYVDYMTHEVDWVRLYVAEDGTRRVALHSDPHERIECPEDSSWGAAQACQLQPADYFEGCLVDDAALLGCMMQPEQWTTSCMPASTAC